MCTYLGKAPAFENQEKAQDQTSLQHTIRSKTDTRTLREKATMSFQDHVPLTYPYFAIARTLPAPLPTVAEIIASKDMFPCIFDKRRICRVGEHFLVKHGQVKLDEADNMHFVAERCGNNVIVPRLYAAFHDEETKSNYIIMVMYPVQENNQLWTNCQY